MACDGQLTNGHDLVTVRISVLVDWFLWRQEMRFLFLIRYKSFLKLMYEMYLQDLQVYISCPWAPPPLTRPPVTHTLRSVLFAVTRYVIVTGVSRFLCFAWRWSACRTGGEVCSQFASWPCSICIYMLAELLFVEYKPDLRGSTVVVCSHREISMFQKCNIFMLDWVWDVPLPWKCFYYFFFFQSYAGAYAYLILFISKFMLAHVHFLYFQVYTDICTFYFLYFKI